MPFNSRGKVYILGYAGVVLATIFGSIGLGAPGWFITSPEAGVEAFAGLWQVCLRGQGEFDCTYIDYNLLDSYEKATQAMACIGVTLLIASTLYGLYVNAVATHLPSSPYVEILAFLGGLCLFIGCMVWVGYKYKRYPEPGVRLGYAMIMATVGSVLAMEASVCVAVGSRRYGAYQQIQ